MSTYLAPLEPEGPFSSGEGPEETPWQLPAY